MICVTAFYPAAGDGRFEMTYYVEKHMPMVLELLKPFGLTKLEFDEGLSGFGPGTPPNYKVVARLYFDTIENFQAGLAAAGNQILGDIPNYTDIPVELQVSKVVSF